MVNMVIESGNLGQAPELRHLPTGHKKCRFSIGVFKPVGQGKPPETNWITVECWNELADVANDGLKTGDSVIVIGTWEVESFEKDGKTSKFHKLLAKEIAIKLKPKKANIAPMGEQTKALDTVDIPF